MWFYLWLMDVYLVSDKTVTFFLPGIMFWQSFDIRREIAKPRLCLNENQKITLLCKLGKPLPLNVAQKLQCEEQGKAKMGFDLKVQP